MTSGFWNSLLVESRFCFKLEAAAGISPGDLNGLQNIISISFLLYNFQFRISFLSLFRRQNLSRGIFIKVIITEKERLVKGGGEVRFVPYTKAFAKRSCGRCIQKGRICHYVLFPGHFPSFPISFITPYLQPSSGKGKSFSFTGMSFPTENKMYTIEFMSSKMSFSEISYNKPSLPPHRNFFHPVFILKLYFLSA